MKPLTIGQIARQAGIGIETVRFYERRGLLAGPARTASGYRQYTVDAVVRLQFIRRAKELGFTLKEIGELLALRVDVETSCAEVKGRANAKISGIEAKIDDLQRMREVLAKLVISCGGSGPVSVCPILDALDKGVPPAPTGDAVTIGSIKQGDAKMSDNRKIEVFSAGCPVCQQAVELVQRIACRTCEVSVLDMHDPNIARRASSLGIQSVPAIVIDGKLADCCQGRGPDEATLRAAGLGQPIR